MNIAEARVGQRVRILDYCEPKVIGRFAVVTKIELNSPYPIYADLEKFSDLFDGNWAEVLLLAKECEIVETGSGA